MTTSSKHSKPTRPRPGGEHWNELTATLTEESKSEFVDWLDQDLSDLIARLDGFVTSNSLKKSLRR